MRCSAGATRINEATRTSLLVCALIMTACRRKRAKQSQGAPPCGPPVI